MDLSQDNNYLESLCKLHLMVAYEGGGNFTKFNKIYSKSGFIGYAREKYAVYNTMQALAIQGVIDLYWLDTGVRWLFRGDCFYGTCVFGEDLLAVDENIPIIFHNSIPIAFQKKGHSNSEGLLVNVSSIGVVADHVLHRESIVNQFSQSYEMYCFDSFKWVQKESLDDKNMILRVKEKFSGFKYFVYLFETRKFYRVLEPDWLFVIGGYMCNFDFKKLLNSSELNLVIPASFRLPNLMSRFLFNNSNSLHLGFNHEYKSVCSDAMRRVTKYLLSGDEHEGRDTVILSKAEG